jgi:periplasmic divalent cation tolerance protein
MLGWEKRQEGAEMPDTTDYCIVYVTAVDVEEARKLAKSVVGRRLAACANITSHMESLYWWQGVMEPANEAVLILKTRNALVAALTDVIKAEHSYKTPCIVSLPITGGNHEFLRWIGDETAASEAGGRM